MVDARGDTLQETTPITDLNYDFFEGWKSRTGVPGFAVYGKSSEARMLADRMSHILTVRYRSLNLADTIGIPERFFTGPEPVRQAYLYTVEVSALSPLEPDPLSPKWNPKNPHGEVTKLLEDLQARPNVLSRLVMPADFYQQFETNLVKTETFPAKVGEELAKSDDFTLDGIGRFLVVVSQYGEGKTEFKFGHFRGTSGGVSMTGSHHLERDTTLKTITEDILAIYGKDLTPIYTAQKV